MNQIPRYLVDANSWLNQSIMRGEDKDQGYTVVGDDGKKVQVNSARYGIDNFTDKFIKAVTDFGAAPRNFVFIWDGENSKSFRRTFLPTYKAGRDKHPMVNEQLNAARDQLQEMIRMIGSTNVWQPQREADDVIGYFAKKARDRRNIICTADGDLSVLHDENTDIWRLGEMNVNPCGPFPHKYITLYKALVGDTTDKIPGAKGFGEETWIQMVAAFGLEGLDAFVELIENGQLQRLREDLADFPKLKFVLDNMDMVYTSYRVASLHIDEVNTMRRPLEIVAGMVHQRSEVNPDYVFEGLERFYGTKTLVTAHNYSAMKARFAKVVGESPFVALDIETSTSDESDEWVESVRSIMDNDADKLDVLGSKLSGMALTFGDNTQHTIYMSVDHKDTANISVEDCREVCEQIPRGMEIAIQNRAFEFPVLYLAWGEKWKDNGYGGFVPNAVDTAIGASYVDENLPVGLKGRSKLHLGYEQTTYEQTTQKTGPAGHLPPGGRVVKMVKVEVAPAQCTTVIDEDGTETQVETVPAVFDDHELREYKMRELTAHEVFDYGCDDTICTAALHTYYTLVMALEQTLDVYYRVETLPEYLTSRAFVKGVPISLRKIREMSKKDDERYEKAWARFREFLLTVGWSGTICPEFDNLDPANVKIAADVLLNDEENSFTTKKRKLNAMAADMREQFDTQMGHILAGMVESNDVVGVNNLLKENFTGEPKINFDSPKQMTDLLYNKLGARPRILNPMTPRQRTEDLVMASAFKKFRRANDVGVDLFKVSEPLEVVVGKKKLKLEPLTEDEHAKLISKASTDDDTLEYALAMDELSAEQREVIKALQVIKTVGTRRKLFYRTYLALPHWMDGRIHATANQSRAATRRYSMQAPNLQQLPKEGEGVEFREVILPHKKNAIVVSLDFSGQELRSMAFQSGDANLTACYVGDNLKDPHSLTASQAAKYLRGQEMTYEEFLAEKNSEDKKVAKAASDLRKDSKIVNFGTQYDMQALALSIKLLTTERVAQNFIDAKDAAFPGIPSWKDEVRKEVEELGYATTLLGARRHLRNALLNGSKWDIIRAGRQGPNFKIQGSAAEQTKLAMAAIEEEKIFHGERFDAEFYAPIHDEVVFSVTIEDAVQCIKAVHKCMVQPYGGMGPGTMPIVSSISLGPNFGVQFELGEEPDEEAINQAIQKVLAMG